VSPPATPIDDSSAPPVLVRHDSGWAPSAAEAQAFNAEASSSSNPRQRTTDALVRQVREAAWDGAGISEVLDEAAVRAQVERIVEALPPQDIAGFAEFTAALLPPDAGVKLSLQTLEELAHIPSKDRSARVALHEATQVRRHVDDGEEPGVLSSLQNIIARMPAEDMPGFAGFVGALNRGRTSTVDEEVIEALAQVAARDRDDFVEAMTAACPPDTRASEFAVTAKALADIPSGRAEAMALTMGMLLAPYHGARAHMLEVLRDIPEPERAAFARGFNALPPREATEAPNAQAHAFAVVKFNHVGIDIARALAPLPHGKAMSLLEMFRDSGLSREVIGDLIRKYFPSGSPPDALEHEVADLARRATLARQAGLPVPLLSVFLQRLVGHPLEKRDETTEFLVKAAEQLSLDDVKPELLHAMTGAVEGLRESFGPLAATPRKLQEAAQALSALASDDTPLPVLHAGAAWIASLPDDQRARLPGALDSGPDTDAAATLVGLGARALHIPTKTPSSDPGGRRRDAAIDAMVSKMEPPWDTMPLSLLLPFRARVQRHLASAHPDKLDRKAFHPDDEVARWVNYFQLLEEPHLKKFLEACPDFNYQAMAKVIGTTRARVDFIEAAKKIDIAEAALLAFETRMVQKKFVGPALAKAKELGRPLVVVPNLTYGGTAATALGLRQLAAQGVKILPTKQGSTPAHENPQVLANLFSSEELQYILEERPLVLVLDGSENNRFPDAFRGYRNMAALLNSVQGVDAYADWAKGGLDEEPFRPHLRSHAHMQKNATAIAAALAPPDKGFGLHFASTGATPLETGFGERPGPFSWENVTGPGFVCVQTAMSREDIQAEADRGDQEAAHALRLFDEAKQPGQVHRLAAFDDLKAAQTPQLYTGERGNAKLNPPVHRPARDHYKTLEQLTPGTAPTSRDELDAVQRARVQQRRR